MERRPLVMVVWGRRFKLNVCTFKVAAQDLRIEIGLVPNDRTSKKVLLYVILVFDVMNNGLSHFIRMDTSEPSNLHAVCRQSSTGHERHVFEVWYIFKTGLAYCVAVAP